MQSKIIDDFTKDLQKRDEEAKLINYYTKNLQKWAIEGFDRDDYNKEEQIRKENIKNENKKLEEEKLKKLKIIENDENLLKEDKKITSEVQTIMIKYGLVDYKKQIIRTEDDMINDIFGKAKFENDKKSKSPTKPKDLKNDPTLLLLSLRDDVDLIEIHNILKRKKKVKHVVSVMPFNESLVSTGEVVTVKGYYYYYYYYFR